MGSEMCIRDRAKTKDAVAVTNAFFNVLLSASLSLSPFSSSLSSFLLLLISIEDDDVVNDDDDRAFTANFIEDDDFLETIGFLAAALCLVLSFAAPQQRICADTIPEDMFSFESLFFL